MYWIGEPLNGSPLGCRPCGLSLVIPGIGLGWYVVVRGSDRCSGVMTASVVFLGARALTLGLVSTTSSRLMMPGS